MGCTWLTLNGTPLAWANFSGCASVMPVPVGPAVPIDWIWSYSMFDPLSTKIALPGAKSGTGGLAVLLTAVTLTTVSPPGAGAAVVVMPATGVFGPIWNVVWLPA